MSGGFDRQAAVNRQAVLLVKAPMKVGAAHKNLLAWREAMALAETIYRDTADFPKGEAFGLASQMRRAAISIPSNIAEGAARNSSGELAQYLGIACGSFAELDTQPELAIRLGYLTPQSEAILQARRADAPASAAQVDCGAQDKYVVAPAKRHHQRRQPGITAKRTFVPPP